MKNKTAIQEKILNQPSYWVEGVNGIFHDIILIYMEENNLNRTELAEYLEISEEQFPQILEEGVGSFSIEKIIEICLKIGKFPVFNFEDKEKGLVGKKVFDKILSTPQSYENDDDLQGDDDDALTPSQMKMIQELKKKIKK